MHGRWRFRMVHSNLGAEYLHSGGDPVELVGSDQQALILADARVCQLFQHGN
jgi:hypothetical protein